MFAMKKHKPIVATNHRVFRIGKEKESFAYRRTDAEHHRQRENASRRESKNGLIVKGILDGAEKYMCGALSTIVHGLASVATLSLL